ncbi:MAG TPA: hypothetical protein VHI52_10395 [Verrucomicrobiae bacterium]|nr:hypothetical protein [Verrucomicrobiae bacterium]
MDQAKPPPVATRPRRGCLFYGCLAGIVCLVAILVAGLLGLHELRRMLDKYTDTKPLPLPAVTISQQDYEQLQRRVDNFRDDLKAGRQAQKLELSSNEINALIAQDPDFKALKGKVYVTIEGDRLGAQISLPMQEMGLPRFKGRYLNGKGTFALTLRNGILDVRAEELEVKGKPVPPTYMDAIKRQNLATGANDNPRASVGLNQLQGIEIRDGQLVLTPKNMQ